MFAACQVFEVNTADTAKGNLKELEAIAAAVIGGVVLTGGFGTIGGFIQLVETLVLQKLTVCQLIKLRFHYLCLLRSVQLCLQHVKYLKLILRIQLKVI